MRIKLSEKINLYAIIDLRNRAYIGHTLLARQRGHLYTHTDFISAIKADKLEIAKKQIKFISKFGNKKINPFYRQRSNLAAVKIKKQITVLEVIK